MKKKIVVVLLVLFTMGAVQAQAAHPGMEEKGDAAMTKHYEGSVMEKGAKGVFTVELIPPKEGLKMGVNAVEMIIHDAADKDVAGAEITITPWMPEHGHGVSEKPEVKERGGGVYSVDNIVLIMTGWWELKIDIKEGDREDTAVFNFKEVSAMGHTHAMTPPKPTDLDTSTMVDSENKQFRVSYAGDRERLPLNRIHTWTLTVKTSDGAPVTGAEITLVGDMPEHGHGLPTEPEVTEELGDGRYLVEGVKFSMPGWWVITFNIKSGQVQDSASFNLFLK